MKKRNYFECLLVSRDIGFLCGFAYSNCHLTVLSESSVYLQAIAVALAEIQFITIYFWWVCC